MLRQARFEAEFESCKCPHELSYARALLVELSQLDEYTSAPADTVSLTPKAQAHFRHVHYCHSTMQLAAMY
jgi:hypothetical protein